MSADSLYIAPASRYVFFNHNAGKFDRDSSTFTPTISLARRAKKAGIPSIMTTTAIELSPKSYSWYSFYLKPNDVTYTVKSRGGAHNLVFPNLTEIIFSGGSLGMCLCEAIRDTIRGVDLSKKSLTIYLVEEAVYADTYQSPFWKYGPTKVDSSGKLTVDTDRFISSISLSKVTKNAPDAEILEFISKTMFNENKNLFCPEQYTNSLYKPESLPLNEYKITLSIHGRVVGSFGNGTKKVDIKIVSDKETGSIIGTRMESESRSKKIVTTQGMNRSADSKKVKSSR